MDDANEALPARDHELTQEREDLILRLWVEARGDFVTNHAGRIQRQFDAERQPAQLPARQRGDPLLAMRRKAGHAKHGLQAAMAFSGIGDGQA